MTIGADMAAALLTAAIDIPLATIAATNSEPQLCLCDKAVSRDALFDSHGSVDSLQC